MTTLNQCEFELESFELVLNESVGFPGMISTINQSLEWQKTVSKFGNMHCKKLKHLEILGIEHKFPITSFLRPESRVELFQIKSKGFTNT